MFFAGGSIPPSATHFLFMTVFYRLPVREDMGGITARTGRLRSVIINNTYPLLYDRGEVRFLRADYFLIIIDNVFFREAVCEDSLLFIRLIKKLNI